MVVSLFEARTVSTSDLEFLLLTCNLFIYMYYIYYLCANPLLPVSRKWEMQLCTLRFDLICCQHCVKRNCSLILPQSWYLQHNWCFLCESFQLTCLRGFSLSSWPVIQPDVGFFDLFWTENPNYARTISLGNRMLQLLLCFQPYLHIFQNVLCIKAGKNTSLMCLGMLRWQYLGPKSQIWVLCVYKAILIYLLFSEHLEQSAAVIESNKIYSSNLML